MIWNLVLVLIFLFGLAIYFNIIKPYLIYRKYEGLLASLGYKTLVHPFRPLKAHIRQMMIKDRQIYGDSAKTFKQVYPHFDLAIGNMHNEATIEIINPDLIKQFYRNANENNYVKADVVTSAFKMLVKHGIIMKEGQEWKKRKKIISSVFTHDFLVQLIPEIHKITISRFDQMEKRHKIQASSAQINSFNVDLHLIFQQIFSEVIVRLFFGSEPTETLDGKNICEFINQIMSGIVTQLKSPLFALFGETVASKKLKNNLRSFKQLAKNLINKRIKQIDSDNQKPTQPRDIIEALILSGQFSYKNYSQYSNQKCLTFDDLIGQFCTFFVAGMDTTSNFMASLVYHLSKKSSSKILKKVKKQIQIVFNQKQTKLLTYKDIKMMNYVQTVQKEGLRMFCPVTGIFFRKAVKAHYIKDIYIPAGMAVVVRNRSNFFKQEYFHEPFIFNPDRWNEVNKKLHPYGYLPFSSGVRTCIGNNLALIQSKVVLGELLKRYKTFELEKENYKMVSTFLYAPEKVNTILEKQTKCYSANDSNIQLII